MNLFVFISRQLQPVQLQLVQEEEHPEQLHQEQQLVVEELLNNVKLVEEQLVVDAHVQLPRAVECGDSIPMIRLELKCM